MRGPAPPGAVHWQPSGPRCGHRGPCRHRRRLAAAPTPSRARRCPPGGPHQAATAAHARIASDKYLHSKQLVKPPGLADTPAHHACWVGGVQALLRVHQYRLRAVLISTDCRKAWRGGVPQCKQEGRVNECAYQKQNFGMLTSLAADFRACNPEPPQLHPGTPERARCRPC